ncbi:MAG TPA: Gmad2 immunoglobulin-like domain-containing protein [Gemmatimonadota bacterium]|nr:Gmad2 immunoglobulin-like domain-containing protein [Gemmatimonadota bacterium]
MKSLRVIVALAAALATAVPACRPKASERSDPSAAPAGDTAGAAHDSVRAPGGGEVPADVRAHIEAHSDLIRLETPEPNAVIESPVGVTGRARGGWYFEGTFRVVLVDWDGRILAEGPATAEGEWTTAEFVPFHATLHFETPSYGERGTLILRKANPSGRPQNDDALEVPVRFGGG